MNSPAILYSFRRCPYAIRARMTLSVAEIEYEHREVLLKDKPVELLQASAKATVPVLVLGGDTSERTPPEILDESIDIMRWALAKKDPEQWLEDSESQQKEIERWVEDFESAFKPNLDAYKYGNNRTEEAEQLRVDARETCESVLQGLNCLLYTSPSPRDS